MDEIRKRIVSETLFECIDPKIAQIFTPRVSTVLGITQCVETTKMVIDKYKSKQFVRMMKGRKMNDVRRLADGLARVTYMARSREVTEDFLGVVETAEEAVRLAEQIGLIALSTESKGITENLVNSLKSGTDEQLVYRIRNFQYAKAIVNVVIQTYIDFYTNFAGFDEHVYDELLDYVTEEKGRSVRKIIAAEGEYLSRQSSETVIPLLAILTKLEEDHHPQLKQLDEGTKGLLSRAYSIAKNNIDEDTEENCLEEFYAGVKGMFDTRPEMIGRWAQAIIEGFSEQDGEGLLREVGR